MTPLMVRPHTSEDPAGEQHVIALLVRAQRGGVDDASPAVHHHWLLRRNCNKESSMNITTYEYMFFF